jgi:spermidine synthase
MNHIPPSSSSLPRWSLPVILGFFFLSGASGLVYEVIWTRVLLTVFGATLYAVATVLAAFMGGLALGSILGGRVADRLRRPLLWYGAVEILVAATALAVPVGLRLFDPLYRAIYAAGDSSFLALSLVRFAVSFAVLMVPTTCMGATLPLLSRFLVRRDDRVGGGIGTLYAVNTTGAVVGTFLAGFALISNLGVHGSIVAAAVVSLTVGVAAIALSRKLEPEGETGPADPYPVQSTPPEATPTAKTPPWVASVVLVSYAVAGFLALSFQVMWTRTLVFRFEVLKNTTYSFSAMLTVFLIGLAVGSAIMASRVNRVPDPVRLYALIQILTGLAGVLSLFLLLSVVDGLQVGDAIGPDGKLMWTVATANVFLRTAVTILLPTLLMGMAFPLAARICVPHVRSIGSGTGRLYAFNTVGAIVGSFATGFLLIPAFGLARGMVILGAGYVVIGVVVLIASPAETTTAKAGWAALGVAILIIFAIRVPTAAPFQEVFPGHFIVIDEEGVPAYVEGPLATVAVMESSIGDRTIYIDNASVAGTDRVLLTDQKSLAHVPMLLLENPKSALTVGFGSGGASWSFLQYRELERVDCIEISPTVPKLSHTLRASNHGVLDQWDRQSSLVGRRFHDGRYRVLIDDARSYLQFSRSRYDIIATDCTDLRYKSNANLYDVEYFELCKRAITDDGLVVVWMPLGGMSPEVFACAMRTFSHVFPDMTIWYMNNEPTHYLLLLGSKTPLRIDLDRLLERIGRPEIQRDLAEISLHQPEKVLSCYLTSAPMVEAQFKALNPVLNTENTPHLEFESPKFGLGDEPMLTNLEILRDHADSVTTYIEDADDHPDFMTSLDRFLAARDAIFDGHAHLRRLEMQQAAASYIEAHTTCPEDESVDFLLRFDELQRRVARYPSDAWSRVTLAQIELLQGKVDPAGRLFTEALALTSASPDPRAEELFRSSALGLADCYGRIGEPTQGLALLDSVADHFRGDSGYSALHESLEKASVTPN